VNGVHHNFPGAKRADADADKVGVVEGRKHGEIHFVGHEQICITFKLN